MKKLILTFLCTILIFSICENAFANKVTPSRTELKTAINYFSILYDYDIQAAQYSQEGNHIKDLSNLKSLYLNQKTLTKNTLSSLQNIKPSEKYNNSYILITNGLQSQIEYLDSMLESLSNGASFDQAFAMNSWNFITAQKYLKEGISHFQTILESYNEKSQQIIISSKIANEQQLINDVQNCSYVKELQNSINY